MALPPRAVALRALAACSSGGLMAIAFPPLEHAEAAWIALVPLFVACRFSSPRQGFRAGGLAGIVFWLSSLSWLLKLARNGVLPAVAAACWLGLAIYCAFYLAAFAMIVSSWFSLFGTGDWRKNVLFIFAAACAWAGLEYVRSVLFTGFPWNSLGVSQFRNASICQLAEWTGVYGVSALIVMFNAAVAMTAVKFHGVGIGRYRFHPELLAGFLILALCLSRGLRRSVTAGATEDCAKARIALVQPCIRQDEKWSEEFADSIFSSLRHLTERSAAYGVDLIVWPETATPYPALADMETSEFMVELMALGTPILAGSTDLRAEDDSVLYFNSSMLFDPGAESVRIYDKQHLAPFGEYNPLKPLPLQAVAPEGWAECTPGKESAVFSLARRPDIRFSPLICFEDAFPALARRAVLAGARLLVDQTNDAWFDVSAGAVQHMAHCVFRCIENRVPAVRAANTGITCSIDAAGRISDEFRDPEDGYRIEGFVVCEVMVPEAGAPPAFYTRHGDVAAAPCAAAACLSFLLAVVFQKRITSARAGSAGAAKEGDSPAGRG